MDIYLIRHGETESNKQKRYIGWSESPLSPLGRRQAEKAASYLAGEGLEARFCSDLQRAKSTANVIGAGCGLKPAATNLLREISFGQWEGLTFDQIKSGWGDAISCWLDNPFLRSAPDGETLAEVRARMSSFVKRMEEQKPGLKSIAAVSHGGSIRTLLHHVLQLDEGSFWDLKIENASVSLIRREDDCYRVIYYNRVHHLSAGSPGHISEEELADGP